jgi:hypothetical protein
MIHQSNIQVEKLQIFVLKKMLLRNIGTNGLLLYRRCTFPLILGGIFTNFNTLWPKKICCNSYKGLLWKNMQQIQSI